MAGLTSVCSMAGGAKATTAATAGPSAPRSITAPLNFRTKWTRAAFINYWRTRSCRFNTQRMVKEYTEQLYIPAARAHANFSSDSCGAATQLSKWKAQMRKDWPQVQISDVQVANK